MTKKLDDTPIPTSTPNIAADLPDTVVAPVKVSKKSSVRKRLRVFFSLFIRLNQFFEDKIPLFLKLGIVTIPALLALVGLSIWLFVTGAIAVGASQKTNLASHLINKLAKVETMVQTERGFFIGYVDTRGDLFAEDIPSQFSLTDAAMAEVIPLLRDLEQEERYRSAAEGLKFLSTMVGVKRQDYLTQYMSINRDVVMEFYTDILNRVADLKTELIAEASNSPSVLPKAVLLLRQRDDVMNLQSLYSIRRALLVVAFTRGSWGLNSTADLNDYSHRSYMLFRDTITNENLLAARYKTQYSLDSWERIENQVFSGREEVLTMQKDALANIYDPLNHSATHWNTLSSGVIDALNAMETELYKELQSDNSRFTIESMASLIAGTVMIFFFAIPIGILTLLVCRMVYKPFIVQKKLQLIAIEIAEAIGALNFNLPSVVSLKNREKKECSALDLCLKQIIVNFESYMVYLPRHLLVHDEIIERETKENDELASMSSKSSTSKSSSTKHSQSQRSTNTRTSKSSSAKRSRAANRISKKNPCVMIIDMSSFVRSSNEMNFDTLQATFADYLTIIDDLLQATNGVMQSFAGGIVICSWGAANKVFEPEMKAAKVALQLLESSYANPHLSFRMKIGITSGASTVGELGNSGMRQFQVIGSSMTRCLCLTKLCRQLDCNILIDSNVYKATNFSFDTKQVDAVCFEDASGGQGTENIYMLVQNKGVSTGEWMYEMQSSEKKAVFAPLNASWQYALKGDFIAARAKLDEFKTDMEGKSQNRVLTSAMDCGLLEKIIAHGEDDKTFRYKSSTTMWKSQSNL